MEGVSLSVSFDREAFLCRSQAGTCFCQNNFLDIPAVLTQYFIMMQKNVKKFLYKKVHPKIAFAVFATTILLLVGVSLYFVSQKSTKAPLTYSTVTPIPTVTPVMPGWKVLRLENGWHLTLQYPPNMVVSYHTGSITLAHSKAGGFFFNIMFVPLNNYDERIYGIPLVKTLLPAPIGKIPTDTIKSYERNTITKVADLMVDGHRAVHFTDYDPGSTQVPGGYSDRYFIMQDYSSYYDIETFANLRNEFELPVAKAQVEKYSNPLEEVINTIRIN